MPRLITRVLAGLAAALVTTRVAAQPADLVFRGGAVHTSDAARRVARAVAVRAGRVVYVGDEAGLARWTGPATRVVDLRGGALLPGFHDSHVHPASGGVELGDCPLVDDTTRALLVAHVARCARDHAGAPWVRGGGWQLPIFPAANPTRALLDSLVPDRPAALGSMDGHSLWVNSRALAAARVTRDTPDPPGGRVERDARTGEPSGTLRESASSLVDALLPPRTAAEWRDGVRRAVALASSLGVTSLQEARADTAMLDAYLALDRAGALHARVSASLETNLAAPVDAEVARLVRLRARYRGTRLTVRAAKIFVDGVIEARTAALLAPYVGGGARGDSALTAAHLDSLVVALDRAKFQVHMHAIGDRAVRMALDAVAAARLANGARDARHHVAHLELVDAADVPRFRALGVAANVQALWAYRDSYIRDLTEPLLGPRRSARIYPFGDLARAGAAIVAGSDWSVTSMDPLLAMQVAVTRRAPDAPPGPAWLPEQRLSLATMVDAYTIRGAWLAFRDRETGSITVGKAADLIVLDRDPFALAPSAIHTARVRETFLDGESVYVARN